MEIPPNDKEVYIKRYKIRKPLKSADCVETTIPWDAFAREARRLELDPEEAINEVVAVWRFNNFSGLYLTFEPKTQRVKNSEPKKEAAVPSK